MKSARLRLVALCGAVFFAACECAPPPVSDGDAGAEGEGEPLDGGTPDAGPPQPPTEPIREPNPDDPNNANLDSDCDGLTDEEEFATVYAGGARTSPGDYDSDDDGVADGVEAGRDTDIDAECPATWRDADTTTTTSPVASDTDGDCIDDGEEDQNVNGAVDDGESNPASIDSDGDGLTDGAEDPTCNGVIDAGETSSADADSDDDGVNDGVEIADGTNPTNPDSDGDGALDGVDPNPLQPDADADGDGLIDQFDTAPNDPDRDDDGLCDGPRDAAGCVAGEDDNGDGALDPGESDPEQPDSDCDALSDLDEQDVGTDPRDPDTDGDLLDDGLERGRDEAVAGSAADCPVVALDTNPGSTTNSLDADSDDDGINDGTEDRDRDGALDPPSPGSTQETDATEADTDGDDICDGPGAVNGTCSAGEDRNRNGRLDAGETDPRVPNVDTDTDGLSDDLEAQLGTDPDDVDSDNDALQDGAEVSTHGTDPLSTDTDCDGAGDGVEVNDINTNPTLADSDGDGIFDGVEIGSTTRPASCGPFAGDQDTATTTDPNNADSDGDGVVDGAEDGNQNGRVDAGELDPDDGADVTPTIAASCADPIDPALFSEPAADILVALAPDFTAQNVADVVADGAPVGVSAVDAAHGVLAYAVRRDPGGADPDALLTAFETTLGATLSLPIRQTFTTWDGFPAVRATYNLSGGANVAARLTHVARVSLGRGENDGAVTVTFPNAPNEGAPYKLAVVVVVRSPDSAVVVGAATNLAQHDDPASGRDFRLEDIGGGTAQAQIGDSVGKQCDVFDAVAEQPVDFIWVLDNSGSMGDELAAVQQAVDDFTTQLANTTLDFRIALVTTEFHFKQGAVAFNGIQGTCTFPARPNQGGVSNYINEGDRLCACQFTNDASAFAACVDLTQDLGGAGAEGGYGGLRSGLNEVFLQGAAGSAQQIRDGARVVAIFVTDAGEQTPTTFNSRFPYDPSADQNAAGDLAEAISFWQPYFDGAAGTAGWDSRAGSAEPPMIMGGILCSFNANCQGEEDSTGPEAPTPATDGNGNPSFNGNSLARDRYQEILSQSGAVVGAISDTNGAGFQGADLQNISATIEAILNGVVGQVAPYQLSTDPIASTIKVAVEGPTVGACNATDVPRSRDDGFAYDAATNTISFFGDCRPATTGTEIAVSYSTWIDLTDDPDGNEQCPPPLVVQNGACLCPTDCGVAGGLNAGQTCDAVTCTPVCLPDCGASCAGAQECDPTSADCGCGCPADCNTGGAGVPPGFVCDAATCEPVCAPDGCDPADRPDGPGWVCGPTCLWECADDCGDPANLGPTERCNATTCTIECSPDCNATCGGGFRTCNADPAVCACECVDEATCAPGFAFDPVACTCTCDDAALACPATHATNLDECRCDCLPNCGDSCSASEICSQSQCSCNPIGG